MATYIAENTIILSNGSLIPAGYTLSDVEYQLAVEAKQTDRVVIKGAVPYFQFSDAELKAEMDKFAEEIARRTLASNPQVESPETKTTYTATVPVTDTIAGKKL